MHPITFSFIPTIIRPLMLPRKCVKDALASTLFQALPQASDAIVDGGDSLDRKTREQ